MGDKYNNWSQGQVAEYVCKELYKFDEPPSGGFINYYLYCSKNMKNMKSNYNLRFN